MFDTPAALVEEVRRLVDALDPAGMTPAEAAAVLSVALDGPTELANPHGRCSRCHRLKTRREASATIRAGRHEARTIAEMNHLARQRAHALINTS